MSHVLHLILVGSATANIEDAEHVAHIATCERIDRVDAYHAVYVEAVCEHL